MPRRFLAFSMLALTLSAGGCAFMPGGKMVSDDRQVYESTPYRPMTITLLDTRTNEVIWNMDLPVGQRLTVQFYPNRSDGYQDYPDLMRWEVQTTDEFSPLLRSAMAVPDRWSRLLEMSLRETPEFYPGAEPVVEATE